MTKLGVLLIVATVACRSKEPPAGDHANPPVSGAEGSATARPTARPGDTGASADASAHQNMAGARPHQAANCPSSLPRTTTQVAMTARGVDVTVTSQDPAVAKRIVALSQLHVRGRTADVSRPHDQHHGGPAWIGYCPILVTDRTTVTVTAMPDGATLHVEARSPRDVGEVQEVIKARAVRLPGHASS